LSELAAHERPVVTPRWVRPSLACAAAVLLVVVLVPPVATEARRYEYFEALRFSVLAIVVPALLVLGAPWRFLRLSNGGSSAESFEPRAGTTASARLIDRLATARHRHLGFARGVAVLLVEMALVTAARTPAVVNVLARHPWLVLVEAVCLVAGGAALWLELVESPPLVPRLARPKRIALAAIAMWTVWITAYVVGLSHASMYVSYHQHLAGSSLSFAADQEIVTFVLWFAAASAYVPIVFWNLVAWLRADEDPDQDLHRLVRENRRRSFGSAISIGDVARPGSGHAG
jgi:cytochrome c oxidase assembly factor CtaG